MARADRLFRLLDALRRLPNPVTAAQLARETEVSERTLYRDIEALRAGGALIDGEPPIPDDWGSTKPSINCTATMASIAFPPCSSTSAPA